MKKQAKKIPATKVSMKRKMKVNQRPKMKLIRSPLVKKDLGCSEDVGISEKVSISESEDEDEKICRSPEEIKGFSYYFDTNVYGDLSQDESESDEDVLEDRDEYDWGFNFVVKKLARTVTNPKLPLKTYFKSDGSESLSIFPVLNDPDFPLAAISKLALNTYNTIRDTRYEYVGLVKAYKQAVNGFHFWTRFKARLPGQDAINFQAITFQGPRNRKTNAVILHFESVYPLPPS